MDKILKMQFFWYSLLVVIYFAYTYYAFTFFFHNSNSYVLIISVASVCSYIVLSLIIKGMKQYLLTFSLLKLFVCIALLDCIFLVLYLLPLGMLLGVFSNSILTSLFIAALAIAIHLFPLCVGVILYQIECIFFPVKK